LTVAEEAEAEAEAEATELDARLEKFRLSPAGQAILKSTSLMPSDKPDWADRS
jgi:hypothetical protein